MALSTWRLSNFCAEADIERRRLRQVPRFVPVNTAPGAPNDGTLDVASTANSAKAQANLAASADSTLATSTSLILPPTIVVPSSATSTVPTTASTPPAITASPSPIDLADGFYVTTQWVATWLDSTSRTWVPQTITLRYKPTVVAPPPGKGEIGMGTLTGKTGVTRTVVLGAAPAQTVGVVRGIVAAVGVGIVGMVV